MGSWMWTFTPNYCHGRLTALSGLGFYRQHRLYQAGTREGDNSTHSGDPDIARDVRLSRSVVAAVVVMSNPSPPLSGPWSCCKFHQFRFNFRIEVLSLKARKNFLQNPIDSPVIKCRKFRLVHAGEAD